MENDTLENCIDIEIPSKTIRIEYDLAAIISIHLDNGIVKRYGLCYFCEELGIEPKTLRTIADKIEERA